MTGSGRKTEEFPHEVLTRRIIGSAIRVHRELGPGLLESTYEACLTHDLALEGLRVERQVEVPVMYRGTLVECGYRLDLLVQSSVIIEIKSVDKIHAIHEAQLLTYMKLAKKHVGLLLNFNVLLIKQGLVRRVITDFAAPNASLRVLGDLGGE